MNTKYRIQFYFTGFFNSGLASLRLWRLQRQRTLQRFVNNRTTIKPLLFYIVFLWLVCLSSCTKVINIKLNESDKQLVIEGTISNNVFYQPTVKISQTKNFEDDNSFVGVSGANVSLLRLGREKYQLTETSPGIYTINKNFGFPGNNFNLTVTLNGNTYTASSTMPKQVVTLDSIWAEEFSFAGKTGITIYPSYKDPPGLGNSYRLVEYKNGVQVNHVFEQNDELSDGLTITRPLINPDSDLDHGDVVRVDLQCIDANVYKYWFSLDQSATGENQSATPTNPVTNIEGGALGYFSAYSVTSQTIIIP